MSPDSPAAQFLGWDGWPTVAGVAVVVAALLAGTLVVRGMRRFRTRRRKGPLEVVVTQLYIPSDGCSPDDPWKVEVHRVDNGRVVARSQVPGLYLRRRRARRAAYRIAWREGIRCRP